MTNTEQILNEILNRLINIENPNLENESEEDNEDNDNQENDED
jgi:hypothetical protein